MPLKNGQSKMLSLSNLASSQRSLSPSWKVSRDFFEEHYVTVPEDKYDAFDTMVEKLDEMEQKANEQVERNIHLNQEIGTFVKESIITDVARGLTETQKDKFASIVEGVGFESEESYRGKIETLKESYFKSETPIAQSDEQEVLAEEVEQVSSEHGRISSRSFPLQVIIFTK